MGEERYHFKEENGDVMGGGSGKGGSGCYVSTGVGFVLTLLAVAVAVGVGLIVHFAEKDKVIECRVEAPEAGVGVQGSLQGATVPPASCRQQILSGGSSLCDLCPRDVTTGGSPMMTTATPGGSKGNNSLRLPTTVKPLYYDLELQPNMYGNDPEAFTFEGHVTIHVECLESTQEVLLHAKELTIHRVEFSVETGNPGPAYVTHDLDPSRDLLIVRLSQRLEVGGHYALHVQFSGALEDDLEGLYLSQYTRNGTTVYLATTQFESADARRAFPCFDEPQLKAHYNVTLVRRSDRVSISNMPILRSDPRAGDMVADVYQTTPLMSTYLLAFIVSDFRNINVTEPSGFTYRIWARPDAQDQIEYALNIGPRILHHYEDYFNISFPLPKQDMIAIPDFASGAMENWGLITYRESNILYTPGVTSPGQKQRVTDVIAHELAHMWFGDLVTMQWWDDIWLNEGFASLVEYMGMDFLYPEWRVFDQFVYDSVQSTFSYDGHTSSHPITILGIEDLDKIEENFDTISYEKAGSCLRMLRFFLGEETFRWGIVNYLSAHKYSNAKHDDLWAALSQQAAKEGRPLDVADVMDTWILQMNYPVVMVTRDGSDLVLTQQRFLANPDDKDPGIYTSPYGYKWTIPFTFTTSTERKFNATYSDVFWMRKEEPIVRITSPKPLPSPGQGGWVLANIRSYGVYRVNYDYDNWRALIRQLKQDPEAIYSTNRAQIINDAWSLAGASMLDMDIALETVEYLDRERDYLPWASASAELSSVTKKLVHTEIYGAFLAFLRNKTEQLYKAVRMNEKTDLLESYIQSTVVRLACGAGLPECVDDAKKLFSDWKTNPDNVTVLPSQLRYRVFCTAAREGSAEDWDFLFRQYRKSTVPGIRSDLMEALTCTNRPWLLSSILDQVTNTTLFKTMDVAQTVYYVTQNTVGQPLAWEWVKANWPRILKDYSSSASTLARLAKGAVDTFNTDHQIQELEAWMSSRDLGRGQRAFGQALEVAKANRKWMQVSYPKVKAWLTRLGFFQSY